MKVVACLLIVTIIGYVACRPEEKYTVKYDNVDLDEILNTERLLKNYIDCLLDDKPCPPDGAELKRILPDALQSKCEKCSEKQKEGSKKVIRHLYKNRRSDWDKLAAKYDPNGEYIKAYGDELEKL
uniref:CSP3 n=1 Tax=Hycleus cichorii TaxID=1270216 RepID=A0A2U9NJD1_9CUCU|nr:CSP3 [Hycleus cichorii]